MQPFRFYDPSQAPETNRTTGPPHDNTLSRVSIPPPPLPIRLRPSQEIPNPRVPQLSNTSLPNPPIPSPQQPTLPHHLLCRFLQHPELDPNDIIPGASFPTDAEERRRVLKKMWREHIRQRKQIIREQYEELKLKATERRLRSFEEELRSFSSPAFSGSQIEFVKGLLDRAAKPPASIHM